MKFKLLVLSLLLAFASKSQINYYFGNLHSHTGMSDGCKDSVTSGVSKPSGAYAYAKLSQNFDFLGVSEHNHYSSARNPGFKIQSYPLGLSQANAANVDGTFLALFGMEWGVSSNYNGHIIIYGFNQLIGWETNNYDVFNAKTDYDGIFKKIKNNPGAFCYLAHPGWSDYTTDGTSSTALMYSAYNATYDSAIVGAPLRSGLAFSTFTDYSDYPAGDYFYYYTKLLSIGYHLGIGYDHDNHNTTFGRNNAGRLVILAPTLTRANLFTAMQKMNFYGSDDWNTKVDFNTGGNIMGSILSGTDTPTFNITHNDGDGEIADSIKIWRGISGSGSLPQSISVTKQSNTKTFTDAGLQPGNQYYYFVEIKQNDGDWIVTSPIWYTYTGVIGLKENEKSFNFNYFPSPVSQKLSISVSEEGNYKISILDVSGRTVYNSSFNSTNYQVDLSGFATGIYSLKIENLKSIVVKKLVIE